MGPFHTHYSKSTVLALILVLTVFIAAFGQSDSRQLSAILSDEIISPSVSLFQLRQYLLNRVTKPPAPSSAQQWAAEAKRLREHLLNDVVFHGWPRELVDAPPRFEELGVMDAGRGYWIRKFRYEIVPGFCSVALLYEPENISRAAPAILSGQAG